MCSRIRMISYLGVLGLAGCATDQPAPVVDLSLPPGTTQPTQSVSAPAPSDYRVVSGDTLYAIAFKHGLDYRDLAAWNGIVAPYRILVGQELRLSAPAHAASAPAPAASASVAAAPPIPKEPSPGEAVTSAAPDRAVAVATSPAVEGSTLPQPSPFQDAPPAAAPAEVPPKAETVTAPTAAAAPPLPTPSPPAPPLAPAQMKTIAEVPAPAPVPPSVSAPAEAPHADATPELSSGGVAWRWPSDGKVIAAYVSGEPTRQGIDIGGTAGDAVRAAASGEVVYSGNGLIGYGELIIVKHNASFLSAYGHNRKRLVKEGDKVKAGQGIAEMGSSASSRDELHFEIRKNGKPVNPLEYLPAR